jgi:hypothetical protein
MRANFKPERLMVRGYLRVLCMGNKVRFSKKYVAGEWTEFK